MQRRDVVVAAAAAALCGSAVQSTARAQGAPAVPAAAVRAELEALLKKQAAQWSSGDLDGFCAHYADDAIFVSPSGRTDGRAAVLARYRKKYVDKAGMGALSLDVHHVLASATVASVVMTWRLAFAGKEPAQGFSVIALEKRAGAWNIVHDASM